MCYVLLMFMGSARVSTDDQTTRVHLGAVKAAGCNCILSETASGVSAERPVLVDVLCRTSRSDTLVLWRLESDGVWLHDRTKEIDTATPNRPPTSHLFGALAQFEIEFIRERMVAGLAAARAQGRKGERPPKLSAEEILVAQRLLKDRESTVSEVARPLSIHRSTMHKGMQGAVANNMHGEPGRELVRAR